MDKQKISETEALDIIARVFDRNMRRMNYVRGELFICWGALLSLTALAEYGLYRWTGDVRVLWSGLVPLVCGYIWTVRNSRRKALVRTGFDDLLILIWGMPAMISAAAIVYAVTIPGNTINPVGVMATAARHGTGHHRRILPGQRFPAIGVVRSVAHALGPSSSSWRSTIRSACRSTPKAEHGCSNSPPMAYCSYCYPVLSSAT